MKKVVIILATAVAAVIVAAMIYVVIGGLIIGGLIPPAPSYNKLDRYLKANIGELSYVIDSLFGLDYDYIALRREDKNIMKVEKNEVYETIPIPDELLEHIEALYKSGVRVISCGRDSMGFTMWSSLSESRGIRYSRIGKKPDGNQLIEVKQMSEENWYYYVNNFEKAKARNPHLFK